MNGPDSSKSTSNTTSGASEKVVRRQRTQSKRSVFLSKQTVDQKPRRPNKVASRRRTVLSQVSPSDLPEQTGRDEYLSLTH